MYLQIANVDLQFVTLVGMGERMSGKKFCENKTFKMAARDSFLMKKMANLPVDHHADYRISAIVFILG
jgi:hypothetical protein